MKEKSRVGFPEGTLTRMEMPRFIKGFTKDRMMERERERERERARESQTEREKKQIKISYNQISTTRGFMKNGKMEGHRDKQTNRQIDSF